jgi:uncharacterized protein YjgD (DUF1641 family)
MSNNIKTATFTLTNETTQVLNLNGLNMNLTLGFFHQDSLYDLMVKLIKALFAQK